LKVSRRKSLTALAAVGLPARSASKAPKIRLIALDVGGTILEDRGDVVGTLRDSFANHGISVTAEQIAPYRGASKRWVIQHFAGEALTGEIYRDFNARLSKAYETVKPIAGAEEAIRKLREADYLLTTTTGFDREIVVPIFHRLGWEKYFAAIVASDDVASGRPSPYMLFHAMETARIDNIAEVLAVGDTPLDLQAASNAGIQGIGVLSGAGTADQLRREPHSQIIPSVASLPALLAKR
jgi:phosphonatase-like hydrolase